MFDFIIKIALNNRILVIITTLVMTLYGGYIAKELPVDVFPDLNRPTVTIMTEAHGLAPEEVETLVTFPLEVALNGTPGVERMRSSSGVGLSIIWLEFDWGTDIYRNRQMVSEKLSTIRGSLPKDIHPSMAPISSVMGEIQLIGLSSTNPDITPSKLRTIADWTLRPRLLSIGGIAQVIPLGGGVEQYQIKLDPEKMRKKNLSIENVAENLQHISENTSGGFVDIDQKEFLIRNLGRVEYIEDIQDSVIGTFRGESVLLKDIAQISIGTQVQRGDASINGRPGVILGIQKQPGSSTLELSEKIQQNLENLKSSLPKGVQVHEELFKQSNFIQHAINNVQEALRDGALFVALILFLFLLNFRTTFISLSAIPVSFAMTAIIFKIFGLEINTMTLGGLAIAVGLLVDDAIVDVENVFRRLKENNQKPHPLPSLKIIFEASKEVRNSILFATLIVILSFIPLFAMEGLAGRLFAPLGISFIISLIASMLVSLTLTPVLCSYLLPKLKNVKDASETRLIIFLKSWDAKIVTRVINKPMLIILPTLILFFASLGLFFKFHKEFLPKFNEGTAVVSLTLNPGVSLAYSNQQGALAESIISQISGVKSVSRRTGRAELDEHAEGVNVSEIDVIFNPEVHNLHPILDQIRDELEKALPYASINLGQPISHRLDHMLSGVNAQIALKIFGPDRDELKALSNQVFNTVQKIPGLVDIQIEKQVEIPQIKSYIIREDAQKYNLNTGKIADLLELALQGEVVAQVMKDQRVMNVFARLSDEYRSELEQIQDLIIKVMPNGDSVRLSQVADVYDSSGPNMINRENMQRRMIVQANVSGEALNKVVEEIQKEIEDHVSLPQGYYIRYDGQYESQQNASRLMFIFGVLAILAIFILIYSHFKSFFISIQIMLSIPLALIGSIVAIYLTDQTISIASLVAFIALCGIASRNGILMISHYLHLMKEEGQAFSKEMVLRGTLERLVPVLMTTISAMLGLLPLLLSQGEPGKEILYPVSVVIIGGLFSSTLLDMWVTPAVFYGYGRKSALEYIANQNNKENQV